MYDDLFSSRFSIHTFYPINFSETLKFKSGIFQLRQRVRIFFRKLGGMWGIEGLVDTRFPLPTCCVRDTA